MGSSPSASIKPWPDDGRESHARRRPWSIARKVIPPSQDAWDAAEYVIALAEVDPASGAPNLGSWSEDAVLFVTAGRSSGERLRTAAELVRGAGLRLRFGILLRTDRTDDSLGMPDPEASSRILRGGAR
jgi:hypothetical protein